MGKKHPKPPVAPAEHPDGFWVYFIRQDDGAAKAHLFNGGKYIETAAKAAWDDALPWAPGTYHTSSTGIVGDKGGIEFRFNSPAIPYREGILMHPGLGAAPLPSDDSKTEIFYNYGSFGCLVAQKDFLQHVYGKSSAVGQTDVPIMVVDKGAHINLGLTLTAKPDGDVETVTKDQEVKFHVKLTGDPVGVSKDLRVFIKVEASGGPPGETVSWQYSGLWKGDAITNVADTTHSPADTQSGFYVTIPRFKKSADFTAKIISDTQSDLTFTIDSYLFDSPKKGLPHRFYSDYVAPQDFHLPKVLIQNGGDPKETLHPIQSLDNLTINTSGGVEGFNETFFARKGATYHFDFDAYDIPDAIKIFDNKATYVDSGFVSGDVSGDFMVSKQSNGYVTIQVTGSEAGTVWGLSAALLHA